MKKIPRPKAQTPFEKLDSQVRNSMDIIATEIGRLMNLYVKLDKHYGNRIAAYKAHVTMAKRRIVNHDTPGSGARKRNSSERTPPLT